MADQEEGVPAPNSPKPTTTMDTKSRSHWSTAANSGFKLVKLQTRIFRKT